MWLTQVTHLRSGRARAVLSKVDQARQLSFFQWPPLPHRLSASNRGMEVGVCSWIGTWQDVRLCNHSMLLSVAASLNSQNNVKFYILVKSFNTDYLPWFSWPWVNITSILWLRKWKCGEVKRFGEVYTISYKSKNRTQGLWTVSPELFVLWGNHNLLLIRKADQN